MSHDYRAHMLQLMKPVRLQPVIRREKPPQGEAPAGRSPHREKPELRNRRSLCREKPMHHN